MLQEAKQSTPATRRRGTAARFIEDKLSLGLVTFTLEELLQKSGLSRTAARNQLLHLGWKVVRAAPRQEFFLILSPEQRVLGAPPVAWWLDTYFRWLGRPYYLALQSAAAEYGAVPEAIQVVQVMTDRPRRELTLGRIRLKFFVKKRVEVTPVESVRNAYAGLTVSTREATCLDLVRYASRIGGIERAAETIGPLLQHMDKRKMLQTLAVEQDTKTAQRFAQLLSVLRHRTLGRASWTPAL
jgi:hypothetical protein